MSDYIDIDLKKLKTIILHGGRGDRKIHISSVMNQTGLDYILYDCIPNKSGLYSGILSLNKILLELAEKDTFEPFLFLEDDINITNRFTSTISIPVDSDCIYLGLSKCFCSYSYNGHTYSPTHKWVIKDANLVKISDMLSTHAFLVTSKKWLLALVDIFNKLVVDVEQCCAVSYDIPVARIQHKFNVYGFKNPFFYQDLCVGGQQEPTKITLNDIYNNVIKVKTIGIVIICTNAYFILGLRFIKKFTHYYRGKNTIKFYLFTDTDPNPYAPNINHINYIHTVHSSWIDGTNSKFKNILSLKNEECDYLFYFDADTNITRGFTEDWFIGDLVGGEHYNNRYTTNGIPSEKPYDRNSLSTAYIPIETEMPQTYYYGAFFGGRKNNVIDFCHILYSNQEKDKLINYEPIWNDESYINNYFHYNPPSFIVSSDKFVFGVSDKGGIDNLRNSLLDIQTYKDIIICNNLHLFDIQYNNIKFYKYNIMYGPWIQNDLPIASIQHLQCGEKVYIAIDGMHTKMVTEAGVAKYYTGTLDDFNPDKWAEYNNVGDNYRVRILAEL